MEAKVKVNHADTAPKVKFAYFVTGDWDIAMLPIFH